MKIIVLGKGHAASKQFNLGNWVGALLSVCVIAPLGIGALVGSQISKPSSEIDPETTADWREALALQEQAVAESRRQAQEQLTALTAKVAELQSRLIRIDALGERLTVAANLDKGEFDFSNPPALGGPEEDINFELQPPSFIEAIDDLAVQIDNRTQQLETLEALIANRKIQQDVYLAGRPIKKGWISSYYGRRTDPFTGNAAWHAGVDFAGKMESDIIAVAGGVVTWSGERYGYGQMVEINHGNGFATRYAHNTENLVTVGEVVKKGDTIALMGSSGRSTGPHVHFEVYKNGRAVDPSSYIHRTPRK